MNGSIVSKTYGLNADLLPATTDNTDIYRVAYQTLFGVAPEAAAPNLVAGTSGDDLLLAGVPGANIDGTSDTIFTGAGEDEVDLAIAGATGLGNNRVNAGSGDDTIFVSDRDRVFGSSGNDIIEATEAERYRVSGGDGDDTFFLGNNGRALGGNGNDIFFVEGGGDNIIAGGEGADQFWIASGDLPSNSNTVIDFNVDEDVIGLISTGLSFSDLALSGNEISVDGAVIATLAGVDTSTLTEASFAFV
ncbi:MAG: hypothetical protein AAGB01_07765 [Cyanobacteria bacterium P01_F01_bin.42]